MKTNKNLIIAFIFGVSTMFASEAKIVAKAANFVDQSVNKSSINLTVESDSDIYGVQFDIKYNAQELNLTEGDIKSKVDGVNIYSRVKEEGIARVLMFGMNGEKILDINASNFADILDINFQAADMFNGISQVELIDVVLAGKGGEELSVLTSTFEVSFNTPKRTSLSKNYPNPFNPSTTVEYELSTPGLVTLVIYDLKGSEVKTLVQEHQDVDYHNVVWNGLNNSGQSVASGRYLLKMSAPGYTESITMTLLK